MNSSVYGQISIQGIRVVALSRNGGKSKSPFASLNLAANVGDDLDAVQENVSLVKELVNADEISVMNADHGNKINFVTTAGLAPRGDGLITNRSNLALVALAADCVPFGLIDPVNRIIAVGHAGWRGVLSNVMASLLDEFATAGADLVHTQAVIGPAICAICYEVPADRVDQFRSINPAAVSNDNHLDLVAGVKSELSLITSIHEIPGCTAEDLNLFSHRRAAGEPTGRGGLIISM